MNLKDHGDAYEADKLPDVLRVEGVRPSGYDWSACPDCGDSLQRVRVKVPDHGFWRTLYIAWCMDCKDIKGYLVSAE